MNKLLRTGRRWPEAGRESELASGPPVKSGTRNRLVTGRSEYRGLVRMTVAICSYNRADYLDAAIQSVKDQVVDGTRVEVLVVDNASTDATKDVVGAHPGVRYVFEGRLGLSRARNRALEEATGAIVAFLDDDAVAVDGWAQHHAAAFADEATAATGGPITLAWPTTRPRWMPVALDGLYAGLDLGSAARAFGPNETPYGANMAMRRATALAVGGFNPKLGRNGASLISNEETEFFARLRADHRVRYVPGARVAHAVVPGRDRLRYVLRRAYAAGRSDVIAGSAPAKSAVARSLIGNLARVVTLRGGGEWGLRGAVAGVAWAAEDVGRLVGTSGRRGP